MTVAELIEELRKFPPDDIVAVRENRVLAWGRHEGSYRIEVEEPDLISWIKGGRP